VYLSSVYFHTAVIAVIPGPTTVLPQFRQLYTENWGSADTEPEFTTIYDDVAHKLEVMLGSTTGSAVIMSAEAMVVLW